MSEKYDKYEDSMNTILLQQCEMHNKLISIFKTSLRDIINPIKGIVVMSGSSNVSSSSLTELPNGQATVFWIFGSFKQTHTWNLFGKLMKNLNALKVQITEAMEETAQIRKEKKQKHSQKIN